MFRAALTSLVSSDGRMHEQGSNHRTRPATPATWSSAIPLSRRGRRSVEQEEEGQDDDDEQPQQKKIKITLRASKSKSSQSHHEQQAQQQQKYLPSR